MCFNSLWMCSGASMVPQPIDKLSSHYSTESGEQSENRENTEGSLERCLLTWFLPCCMLPCCSQHGAEEEILYSLIPAFIGLRSGKTLSRLSLPVDPLEGLDNA